LVEWDADHGLVKVNPLINWTEHQVVDFIKTRSVPYNPLHDQGFPSIGCQPCTRAIIPGEEVRAGRWWWEHPESRECGLHKK
jgi:phosphoadenosine phosphosulfate reductase